METLSKLVDEASRAFARAASPAELEQVKARYLGKAGALSEQMKGLTKLAPGERPVAGARIYES